VSAQSRVAAGLVLLTALVVLTPPSLALAEAILLPRTVPSFNQNYTDGPDAWGDCPLGTAGCPDQVCTTGCLVTAFSSVLAYYEIDVSVPPATSCTGRARSGMDPGILNDWLRANRGFGHCAQDPLGDCCLAWDRLPGDLELTFYSNRSENDLNPVASVVIDHALREGRPVVAGVHWGASCRAGSEQTEDCHWVVLTGKAGDTYTIVDPINFDVTDPRGVRTTLDDGTHGNYIIDRFVVVSGPTLGSTAPSASPDLTGDSEGAESSGPATATTAVVFLGLLAAVVAIIALVSARNE